MIPTMSASTIVKFADDKTKYPSQWTIRKMTELVGFQIVLVPIGTTLPAGATLLE